MPLLLPTRLSWDGLAGMGPARVPAGLLLLVLAGASCLAVAPPSGDVRRGWRQVGFWTAASLILSTRVIALFDLTSFELPHFFSHSGQRSPKNLKLRMILHLRRSSATFATAAAFTAFMKW